MSEELQQLSMLEQNLGTIISQKQTFNKQLLEIESALSELESTTEAYHIVGSIMIKKSSEDLKKELLEKKELLKVRLESFEKQESTLRSQAKVLQDKVMNDLDNNQ